MSFKSPVGTEAPQSYPGVVPNIPVQQRSVSLEGRGQKGLVVSPAWRFIFPLLGPYSYTLANAALQIYFSRVDQTTPQGDKIGTSLRVCVL